MADIGIDIEGQRSDGFEALPVAPFEAIVTMGCGDACPTIPARQRFDWAIPDPREMEPEAFHGVRDTIRDQVHALLTETGVLKRDA